MQHYTEKTWDPKVIEAVSAFVITAMNMIADDRIILKITSSARQRLSTLKG